MDRPTLQVDNLELGAGIPKLIVPVTGRTAEQVLEQVDAAVASPADIVEWRADHFEQHRDAQALVALAHRVAEHDAGKVVLFTIRTAAEGGESDLPAQDYLDLVTAVAATKACALVDVEYRHELAQQAIDAVHAAGGLVVASNHDFHATPPAEEIEQRLATMEQMGADVCKIAVMPTSPADVATLLLATARRAETSGKVLLTMSMGPLGGISRLSGGVFGSVATFATVGAASAPGQMAIDEVVPVLHLLQR